MRFGENVNCDFFFIFFYIYIFFFLYRDCIFFDLRFYVCKVKLQLNIVSNVQKSMNIVTLLKKTKIQ